MTSPYRASQSHSDTPHSLGRLWTSYHPHAETSTCEHATRTRDRHPCRRRDSNLQSQQASGSRPTPQTAWVLEPAFLLNCIQNVSLYVTERRPNPFQWPVSNFCSEIIAV